MQGMDYQPVLLVLLYSSLAAALSMLGALPFRRPGGPGAFWIGSAYGFASGLMLGTGYLLMTEALGKGRAVPIIIGAGLGIGFTWWTQSYAGTDELQRDAQAKPDRPEYGYKILLQNAIHSAAEGVAIGVSMAFDLSLGIFIALSLAVHNVGEATAMTSLLTQRGVTVRQAAGLCVSVKTPQVVLAVAAFALSSALRPWLPLALGIAAGAMVYLVISELLPSSYRRMPKSAVALFVSVSAGTVVLLRSFFVSS
ncbi:MAG TPA: ZIP family metal transporter [Acidobacteriota bacterium]|nr:ZIP family metal transporter [Acidobacteriota bacterium]